MTTSKPMVIRHWIDTTPEEVWRAYTTPEIFHPVSYTHLTLPTKA